MNEIKVNTKSMENSIQSLQAELARLTHFGEVVASIPEINEMNPNVYLDHTSGDKVWGGGWTCTVEFEKCYARIYDSCRIRFVHYDDEYMNGRKEELVPFYEDDQLIAEFKKHVDFLK